MVLYCLLGVGGVDGFIYEARMEMMMEREGVSQAAGGGKHWDSVWLKEEDVSSLFAKK